MMVFIIFGTCQNGSADLAGGLLSGGGNRMWPGHISRMGTSVHPPRFGRTPMETASCDLGGVVAGARTRVVPPAGGSGSGASNCRSDRASPETSLSIAEPFEAHMSWSRTTRGYPRGSSRFLELDTPETPSLRFPIIPIGLMNPREIL
jgi:hypothetical protein